MEEDYSTEPSRNYQLILGKIVQYETEDGVVGNLALKLEAKPRSDVVIFLNQDNQVKSLFNKKSSDNNLIFIPSSLTFNALNWNVIQAVTIISPYDDYFNNEENFSISMTVTSDDSRYNNITPPPIRPSKNTEGIIIVSDISNHTTEESGPSQKATFTIVLGSSPAAKSNVEVTMTSLDETEGFLPTKLVTFTSSDWNIPQIITVVGVDDNIKDGNIIYDIKFKVTSSDTFYHNLRMRKLPVINIDNESSGLVVGAISGNTSEDFATATFTVAISSQPLANVTVNLSSSRTSEGIITSAPALIFTFTNWNTPQTVTVTGVDDNIVDGSTNYTINFTVTSADKNFHEISWPGKGVINTDNDVASLTVSNIIGNTTEAGGTATFTLKLDKGPTSNVMINVISNDLSEGIATPAILTFTTSDWRTPKTVTVTGVDDYFVDGTITYAVNLTMNSASAASYRTLSIAPITVTNLDNDTAGLTMGTVIGNTSESGGHATFTVRLNSQPAANVVLNLTSTNTFEGIITSSKPLNFTSSNWDILKTVTVTGVNDDIVDGNISYAINLALSSSDSNYNTLANTSVSLVNFDNDVASLAVGSVSGNTSEGGNTATFSMVLTSKPTGNVTINLESSHEAEGIIISDKPAIFTTGNWNATQTVTLRGVDDSATDGNFTYSINISLTSGDSNYHALSVSPVSVINNDDDIPGVGLSAISGSTSESGGTATFSLSLNTQPTKNVTVEFNSTNSFEGNVSTDNPIIFTSLNWNFAQTVSVIGADDFDVDGSIGYIINLVLTSADSNYHLLPVTGVNVINTDNDVYGFTLSGTSAITTEGGGTDTFSIKLNARPTDNVRVSVTSSLQVEGTVAPSILTFTSGNWSTFQTVMVTGVNDSIDDGDITYNINLAVDPTSAAGYRTLSIPSVTVVNQNDDTRGTTVSGIVGNTTEGGGTATFTMSLNTQPTADVTVSLSSSDNSEGTVTSSNPLTFTSSNWSSPQTVTVTGVDDNIVDGSITYAINFAFASGDSKYHTLATTGVSVINIDNDVYGFTLNDISGNTSEYGGTATFSIKLNTQPTSNVRISVISNNLAEGTVAPAILTFTSTTWGALQTVTVTGVNDDIQDGDITYSVSLAVDPASFAGYATLTLSDVIVINSDDADQFGFTRGAISGATTEAGGNATFTLRLNSRPVANVTVNLSSSLPSEGTVTSVNPLIFTTAGSDWSTNRTVTVTGVPDNIVDGNVTYTVNLNVSSSDTLYNGATLGAVSVVNNNIDVGGFNVSSISGNTNESGTTATFTVSLTLAPSGNVMISVLSNTPAEGVASPAILTFTTGNWSADQTVTVTGVDDNDNDGDKQFLVALTVDSTSAIGYKTLTIPNVTVINEDDDGFGINLAPLSGSTNEGQNATFTMSLAGIPTGNVSVTLTSTNTAGGTITSPNPLTFSPVDWSTPKTITVTGGTNSTVDFNISYNINFAVTSSDVNYDNFSLSSLPMVNIDTNIGGVNFSANSGTTSENLTTFIFTASLTVQPVPNITISVNSSNTLEATVLPSKLTFTSGNWNLPKTVTVTGVDDFIVDGDVAYNIIFSVNSSAPNGYKNLSIPPMPMINTDNEYFQKAYIKSSNNKTGAGDSFGIDVKISGDTIAVGAANDDSYETTITNGSYSSIDKSNSNSGAVHVYRRTGDVWEQEAYIKASNNLTSSGVFFGSNIALSGDTLAVGHYYDNSFASTIINGPTSSTNFIASRHGSVFVYKRTGSSWAQQAYIKASNHGAYALGTWVYFGRTVSISGDTLVVSMVDTINQTTITNGPMAPTTGVGSANASGGVFVYKRTGSTWVQEAYLKAPNFSSSPQLGASGVAINDDTIVAVSNTEKSNQSVITNGPTSSTDISLTNAGAAFVFKRTGSTWVQQAYIKPGFMETQDKFGTSADISGDTIVIGAIQEDSLFTTIYNGPNQPSSNNSSIDSGAAYVYKRTGASWALQAFLKPSNTHAGTQFGNSVSIDGDTIVVGSHQDKGNSRTITHGTIITAGTTLNDSGAAYIFRRNGTTWKQIAYIKASNADNGDKFSSTVSISGDSVVVSSALERSEQDSITNGPTSSDNNNLQNSGAVYVY